MSQHKCTCNDPNCKGELFISTGSEPTYVELTAYGPNGSVLLYLDGKAMLDMAMSLIEKSYQVETASRESQDRIWSLIGKMRQFIDLPVEDRTFHKEDTLYQELESLLALHEKGKI